MANRIEITLSDERLAALDAARGNEARASFIKRAMDAGIAFAKVERERATVRDRPLTAEQQAFIADRVAQRKPLPYEPLDMGDVPETPIAFKNVPAPPRVGPKPAAARNPRPKGGKR